MQVEAKVPDVPIAAVSLKSFFLQEPLVAQIDKALIDLLEVRFWEGELTADVLDTRTKAAKMVGFTKVEDIREALTKYGDAVVEYVGRCSEYWVIGRDAALGSGACLLFLAIMLAAAEGEKPAADAMAALSRSIAFNFHLLEQVETAREIVEKYSKQVKS